MNRQKAPIAVFCFLFLLLVSSCHNKRAVFVGSNDNMVRYTGRVGHDGKAAELYWPGTQILVKFRGDSLKALMKDEHGKNYFDIIIDDDSIRRIKLDTAKRFYALAAGLPKGTHTVKLFKTTEWDQGKTWFYGMRVNGGSLKSLPPKNKRIIEFFGNSITAGYAIDDLSGHDSPDSTNTNNYYSYAAITAGHYHADYYCTVKSGIGIMISWFPLIMPELYDRLDPANSSSKWDFSQVTPDLVVINLFQNDSWLVKKPEHPSFKLRFGTQAPDSTAIVDAYKSFVERIRDVYPNTPIICALGPMDATQKGSPWPGYVRAAVGAMHDQNIKVLFFPFMNKSGHPRRADHRVMADTLIKFIDRNIQW